jgi:hypothetical protein
MQQDVLRKIVLLEELNLIVRTASEQFNDFKASTEMWMLVLYPYKTKSKLWKSKLLK